MRETACGAEYSITQMFFDVDDYLRLRDRVIMRSRPGRQADHSGTHADHLAAHRAACGGALGRRLPPALLERLERAAGNDPEGNREAVREVGIEIATEIGQRLIAEGAPCLHFITLNFAKATTEVLANLGYTMAPAAIEV